MQQEQTGGESQIRSALRSRVECDWVRHKFRKAQLCVLVNFRLSCSACEKGSIRERTLTHWRAARAVEQVRSLQKRGGHQETQN